MRFSLLITRSISLGKIYSLRGLQLRAGILLSTSTYFWLRIARGVIVKQAVFSHPAGGIFSYCFISNGNRFVEDGSDILEEETVSQ